MTRHRRLVRLVAALALLALVGGACAKKDTDSEEVRVLLDETLLEAHRFVYTEKTPDGAVTTVQGIVEDDFRYQARMLRDGDPVLDRVVSDDTVAVRFIEPETLAQFVDKEMSGLVETDTDIDGVTVFDALQARRWVVDPGGAPPQLVSVDAASDPGVDPIFDALRQIDRARAATLETEVGFVEYDEDSISLVYRADEDPFPVPESGSGVTRFDLVQPEFPTASEAENGALPGEGAFRKMVVYVKDGRVIQVMEDIGLTPSRLDDFRDFMLRLVATGAPEDVRAGFESTVESTEGAALGQFLLDSLNTFRDLQGDPPVRFRTTSYELLDIGDDALQVTLPAGELITADLAVLVNLGIKSAGEGDEGTTGGSAPADDGAPAADTQSTSGVIGAGTADDS